MYKTFDYLDQFSIIYNFNILNFKTTQQYLIRASFVGVGVNSINNTRMNVRPPKHIECLPQQVYNETIAAEIFDIDDYL